MDVTIRYVDSPRVFGALLVPQRAAIVAQVGAPVLERALLRVPRDARDEYEALKVDGWCRGETVEQVVVEVAREASVDAGELTASSVHTAITGTVGRLWRTLLVMTSDLSLVRRTPMFYARSYDRGSLSGARTSPGHAELWLDGWPHVPELHAVGIAAGVKAVMELAGRSQVAVRWHRDGARALFELSWNP